MDMSIGTTAGAGMSAMLIPLLIGLVIRIPFVKLNHFVEERMEDTELM